MSIEENIKKAGQEEFLKEKSELAETFAMMDNSEEDKKGRSAIDFNTRLSTDQIDAVVVVDQLQAVGLLPEDIDITTTIKRLNVSINGEGRKEKVQIAQGQREEKSGRGFMSGFFGKRDNGQ